VGTERQRCPFALLSFALLSFALLPLGSACESPRAARVLGEVSPAEAPADRGDVCLDVGETRACWGGDCAEQGCVVPRPLPDAPLPPSGFRCRGQGAARVCEARARQAGAFACDGGTCVQHRARTPDNGEWECVDASGGVYCRNVVSAAGVADGALDGAFVCGVRERAVRGASDASEHAEGRAERICVDFSPDLPPDAGRFACRVSYMAGVPERVCTRAAAARLGDACTASGDCPRGAACVTGRCIPPRPKPACWFDRDCGAQRVCRFGSCVAGPT
jgi:hypothetical protein